MQEILFRGKRRDNGQWCEGFLYRHDPPLQCIAGEQKEQAAFAILKTGFADWNMPRPIEQHLVHGETVSRYTGLMSHDNFETPKKAFYGDIVRFSNTEGEIFIHPIWWDGELQCTMIGPMPYSKLYESGYIQPSKLLFEIIGNVHDNPELINNQISLKN